jgi:hypothetical protein
MGSVDTSQLVACWSPKVVKVTLDVIGNLVAQIFHHVTLVNFPYFFRKQEGGKQ